MEDGAQKNLVDKYVEKYISQYNSNAIIQGCPQVRNMENIILFYTAKLFYSDSRTCHCGI